MASSTGALCLVSAVALLLSMVCHGSSVLAAESQEVRPVIGCVDARATYVLTDQQRAARHTAKWRAGVERRGRCFAVAPGAHWERIVSIGGLMLMRRTPPEPGMPPLYFRSDTVPDGPEVSAGPEERGANDQAAVPRAILATKPLPGLSSRPSRMVLQTSGQAEAEVRTEDLPPLPAPAEAPAAVAPPLDQASPTTFPQPDGSPASSRSYAVGFALVIVLIVLLLAAMALLLRFLLYWLPRPGPVNPVRESTLPPVPVILGSGRNAGRQDRPVISRVDPDRRRPVVHQPVTGPEPATGPVVPVLLQAVGLPPGSDAWLPEDRTDIQRHCILLLREAGWDARSRRSGQGHADVVARRNNRVMALLCLPGVAPVDEQSVEEACMARERERADVAVIVSKAAYTAGARRLAVQTGVDLLDEDGLRAFAR